MDMCSQHHGNESGSGDGVVGCENDDEEGCGGVWMWKSGKGSEWESECVLYNFSSFPCMRARSNW